MTFHFHFVLLNALSFEIANGPISLDCSVSIESKSDENPSVGRIFQSFSLSPPAVQSCQKKLTVAPEGLN